MRYLTSSADFFKDSFVANMDGDFDCFECDEYVEAAFYDAGKGTIVYKCSKGHVSKLELK